MTPPRARSWRSPYAVGDVSVVPARPPGERARPGDQGLRRGDRRLLVKRPRGSQLGAWASHQSKPIVSRAALLEQLATCRNDSPISTRCRWPPNWGGIPHRAGGCRILAGPPGRRGATDSRSKGSIGAAIAPHRCGHRTSGGCGWQASSRSLAANLTIFAVPVQLYALTKLGVCRAFRAV